MRVVTYSRVSTEDQKAEIQVEDLRKFCKQRDHIIVKEFVDAGYSGGTDDRPSYRLMMSMVEAGEIEAVVITKLDRLFRSILNFMNCMATFEKHNVRLISSEIDIDWKSPIGRMIMQQLSVFAEFERELIRDRTRRGMARAKEFGTRNGNPLGRPAGTGSKKKKTYVARPDVLIAQLANQNKSYRQIAEETGCTYSQVQRSLSSK